MDPLNTLKKFKNIQPDRSYTEKSRGLILSARREARLNVWNLILKNVELGATFAIAGILILLIIGGFPSWKGTTPLRISNLDPAGLKAEATAIDMQIQLMNLNYVSAAGAKAPESTPPLGQTANKTTPATTAANATSTNAATSTSLSVDEAFSKLSE